MTYGKANKQIHKEHTHAHAEVQRDTQLKSQKNRATQIHTGAPTRLQSWKCGVGRVGFVGLYLTRGSYACMLAQIHSAQCVTLDCFQCFMWARNKNTHAVLMGQMYCSSYS